MDKEDEYQTIEFLDRAEYLKVKMMPNSTPLPECSPDEVMVERRTEFPFGRTFTPIVHEPKPFLQKAKLFT